jgi:hypothetical protein
MSRYVCEDCREEIDREASTCPHCGHDGTTPSGMFRIVAIIVGGLLTMTLIGAIIGLPMMWWGWRGIRKQGARSPGVEVDATEA